MSLWGLYAITQGVNEVQGPLEVVSSRAEFETIPIRRYESALLHRIYDRILAKLISKHRTSIFYRPTFLDSNYFQILPLIRSSCSRRFSFTVSLRRRDVVECLVERPWCYRFFNSLWIWCTGKATPILYHICECKILQRYLDKHGETYLETHRLAAIVECNESIAELRNAIRDLIDAINRPSPAAVPSYWFDGRCNSATRKLWLGMPTEVNQPKTGHRCELVPIASLPKWAQEVFMAKSLNRCKASRTP